MTNQQQCSRHRDFAESMAKIKRNHLAAIYYLAAANLASGKEGQALLEKASLCREAFHGGRYMPGQKYLLNALRFQRQGKWLDAAEHYSVCLSMMVNMDDPTDQRVPREYFMVRKQYWVCLQKADLHPPEEEEEWGEKMSADSEACMAFLELTCPREHAENDTAAHNPTTRITSLGRHWLKSMEADMCLGGNGWCGRSDGEHVPTSLEVPAELEQYAARHSLSVEGNPLKVLIVAVDDRARREALSELRRNLVALKFPALLN